MRIIAATQLSYDAAGNITTITDPRTNTTNFTYNALNQLTQTTSPAPFNYLTKYSYDRNGNLTQIDRQTDDPGNPWQTTTYTYTILDELATIADDLGNITTFGYDANGNRSSVQDAKLNTTTYVYDERGLLWKVTDALSNTTEYSYDGNENLLQLKDAKSNTTTYQYDDFNRLTQTTYPDSTTESYSYDKAANLLSKTNRRSQIISYAYDELNRITTKTTPETTINYAYDAASRLTSVIASGSEAISYVYDALNRVTSVTYPGPRVVSYEYDTAGNRTKLTYPDSTYITYSYDTMNRLTNIINSSAQNIATYSYDKLSRRIGGNFLNGTSAGYTYDAIDRLTQLANTYTPTPSTYSYTYDNVGNRLTKTDNTGAETYTYDNIYQLTNVTYPDTSSTAYNYDGVGNRTSTVNGGTTTYTSNNLNQYSEVNSIPYTYDSSGNLTSDGTQIYTYDSENRLSHVIPAPPHTSLRGSEATEAIYTYDAFGRRIEKAVTINSQLSTINYLYDGDQVICEYEAGAISAKYVYGAGIDEPITMQRGGETYYYHFDGLGSVTALTNNTGALVESYSYDVYGNTIIKDASGNPLTQSAIGNHFGFTGRELDNETGLYHYRARAYSPTLGRFLQTDPVGYYDDINLYRYCWNNPINYIDPFGLCKEENKGVLPGGIYNPNVINATIKLPRPEVEKQTGIPTSKNPTPTEPSRRPTEVNIALDAVAFAADVVGTVVPPAFIPAYVVGTTASITNLSYTESQYHKGKATRLDVWVSRTTTAIGIIPGPVGIIGSVVQLAYDLIRQRVGP